MQFILGLGLPQYTTDILRQLEGNFVYLAMNKYGSNVVEKCLRESTEDQISEIISELVYSKDFLMLLQDQYGNYVAQSALEFAKVYIYAILFLFNSVRVVFHFIFKYVV